MTTDIEDIPSPLRTFLMRWQPILAEAYPNHVLAQIEQRMLDEDPDNILLFIKLIPTSTL